MKFLFQPTLATPGEWEEYDSGDWRGLAKKDLPIGREAIDDVRGWCHGINVQGVEFQADHYHVEPIAGGLRVTVINDDPIDFPAGFRFARVWDFLPLAEDPAFGGAFNTRQTQTVYHEVNAQVGQRTPKKNTTFLPFAQFTSPPADALMHGKQTTNALNQAHRQKRGIRGWRNFTEGVPPGQIVAGRVRGQKRQQKYKPNTGTRVYQASNTALANGIHVAVNEFAALLGISTPATVQVVVAAGSDDLSFVWVTPANEPNSAAWPAGTYRMQLDITAIGGNTSCGFLTIGGSAGHFARVNAAIAADLESFTQVEAAFTGTGLNLATTGVVAWAAGTITDRFECLLAQENAGGMMDEELDLELNELDDFIDGPWPGITFTPTPAVATWVVPTPSVHGTIALAPTPAVATWVVPTPVARLRTTFIPMPATARWLVPSPNVTQAVRGIGGDLIVTDIIEKTIIVPD